MSNSQIRAATVADIARAIAAAFLFSDIGDMGRDFDNLWENGRGKEIAQEFGKLYHHNAALKHACNRGPNGRYFCAAMVGKETLP